MWPGWLTSEVRATSDPSGVSHHALRASSVTPYVALALASNARASAGGSGFRPEPALVANRPRSSWVSLYFSDRRRSSRVAVGRTVRSGASTHGLEHPLGVGRRLLVFRVEANALVARERLTVVGVAQQDLPRDTCRERTALGVEQGPVVVPDEMTTATANRAGLAGHS